MTHKLENITVTDCFVAHLCPEFSASSDPLHLRKDTVELEKVLLRKEGRVNKNMKALLKLENRGQKWDVIEICKSLSSMGKKK